MDCLRVRPRPVCSGSEDVAAVTLAGTVGAMKGHPPHNHEDFVLWLLDWGLSLYEESLVIWPRSSEEEQ